MTPSEPAPPAPRRAGPTVWLLAAVALAALLPSLGTLDAPWVAEDTTILGHVHRENALRDWIQPQYGLRTLRFWRPVVSLSWEVQERLGGTDPGFLRGYNLFVHGAAAVLAALLALRLGTGRAGALAAGLAVALFPEQGGTVTWLAGRTDGTVSPLVLLTLVLAADGRARLACAAAFLACAAKEMAFVLPAWTALFLWARGPRPGALPWRPFLGVLAGTVAAFLWRRAAVGSWLGGYPAPPVDPAGLWRAAATWARSSSWALGAPLLLGGLGALLGTLRPRLLAAGLACAVLGAVPLLPLLVDGVLEATNARTLRVPDLGLALALAAAFARPPRRLLPPRAAVALLALGLVSCLGWRGLAAWRDTHEWAAAGEEAAREIRAARSLVGEGAPSAHPWLFEGFSPTYRGAYCLAYGVADRFRPPFEAARLPVWPLRPLFARPTSRRTPVVPVEEASGLRWIRPFERPSALPPLEVLDEAGEPLARLVVDRRVLGEPDRSPVLALGGAPPRSRLELILYTEAGYEPAPAPPSLGRPGEPWVLTLRGLLLAGGGHVTLGETLVQAADLGAARAFLEVRALDAAGRVVAAAPWLELTWEPDLVAAALGP